MKLLLVVPWWYKPFVRFMPNFYEECPPQKSGDYKSTVAIQTSSFFYPTRLKKWKHHKDLHSAYLSCRWRALWVDFWTTGSYTGVDWVIRKVK